MLIPPLFLFNFSSSLHISLTSPISHFLLFFSFSASNLFSPKPKKPPLQPPLKLTDFHREPPHCTAHSHRSVARHPPSRPLQTTVELDWYSKLGEEGSSSQPFPFFASSAFKDLLTRTFWTCSGLLMPLISYLDQLIIVA